MSNPNLQQVSKQESECRQCRGEGCPACHGSGIDLYSIRRCFGPAPGREWWKMDAKNIELRLPAYESGEADLIDLFERPRDPPYYGSTHLLNFHTVYPDLWEEEERAVGRERVGPHIKKKFDATYYQWCKNGGFAVQYGAIDRTGGIGTADRAFHRPGSHARLKSRFSRLDKLNQKCIRMAEQFGYVETIPDRSVDPNRGYPLLCSRSDWGNIIPTVPLNYHVQGSAMWWMGKAMVRCQAKLDEWQQRTDYDGRITLQVHDELVFDLPKRGDPIKSPKLSNLWRVRVLQRLMEQGGDDFGIPTPVSVEYHPNNWSEGITL